jgi:hypothetical protein
MGLRRQPQDLKSRLKLLTPSTQYINSLPSDSSSLAITVTRGDKIETRKLGFRAFEAGLV